MKISLLIAFSLLGCACVAQRNKEMSFAITNSNSAFPFSKFGSLFTSPFHPGVEVGYGFNWKTKKSHDWFQQVKAGYFYHRFIQHGIPIYSNFGYRQKFNRPFYVEASLGAGYLHSIPATAKLKLNSNGEYENNKGIGRGQGMVVFNIGGGYNFTSKKENTIGVFITYQQRLQTPFIKSYVPLLPYNSFMIGFKKGLQKKSK